LLEMFVSPTAACILLMRRASLIVVSLRRFHQLDRDDLASVVSVGVVIDRDFERNLAVKAGLAITSIECTPGPSISSLAADCGSGTDLSR